MEADLLRTPLGQLPVAAIDFESAGAAPGETDCPVQVGIVRTEKLPGELRPEHCYVSYIAAEHPVRWSAAKVHGITTEKLAGAPSFVSLWPELKQRLSGCAVIGHNPATEQRFLRAFPGHGFGPWIDTLVLARQALPQLADHSLSTVCDALGLTAELNALLPERRWHDALYDAAGSLLLLRFLVQVSGLAEVPLGALSGVTKGR